MEVADLLETMRREAREDHLTLVRKVEDGFAQIDARAGAIADDLATHQVDDLEKQADVARRLQPLEVLNKNMQWFLATVIAAFIMVGAAGVWDYVENHMQRQEVTHAR